MRIRNSWLFRTFPNFMIFSWHLRFPTQIQNFSSLFVTVVTLKNKHETWTSNSVLLYDSEQLLFRKFTTERKENYTWQMSANVSWVAEPGGLGGCSPLSFCQIFAKSPFFASNFSISMPTAPSRSSQPRTFKFTPPSMCMYVLKKCMGGQNKIWSKMVHANDKKDAMSIKS